jgi:superfamily II DNA or RNA helicase
LKRSASDLRIGVKSVAACVATHDALRSARFAAWFTSLPPSIRTVLVGDEVHNLGSPRSLDALNGLKFDARLGLSATPRRWSDEETTGLFEYFGDTVFEFTLERAIREGYLVPYAYYPHVVELSDDEFGRYAEISRKLAKLGPPGSAGSDPATEEVRGALLRQRAAVLNNAEDKLNALADVVDGHRLRFALVYTTPEQMDDTVSVVADDGRRLVHRFTYRESAKERQRLLRLFESGGMEALVAIRCLDEGVDIPRTETAYILASSSNSREFIQRRGRILRRADGKDRAVIHDFLAVPPRGVSDERTWAIERSVMKRELARFDEFASLALNRYEAESALLPVRRRYGLF